MNSLYSVCIGCSLISRKNILTNKKWKFWLELFQNLCQIIPEEIQTAGREVATVCFSASVSREARRVPTSDKVFLVDPISLQSAGFAQ